MKSKALLLLIAATQLTCHQALFTAPPGTSMECFANPTFIAAFNGVSTVSCVLNEETGTPVADGTVVQFFTNLGRIPEQGRTNDGVVRVNLTADGRSGTANVRAVSGSGTGGGGSGSTSTAPTSTSIPVESSGVSRSAGSVSAALLAAVDVPPITIGNPNARSIRLAAFPPRLTDSRTAQLTATVFDDAGNPVTGVPVFFEVTEGSTIGPVPSATATPVATPVATPSPTTPPTGNQPLFEHLDSQGQPRFTDSNGQAFDVLRTRYPREAPVRQIVVVARVPVGNLVSNEVRIFVN
jgi:hypothetical protein